MSHVSIQPPVKKLRQGAFKSKRTIHQVDFYDGLLGIGRQSFQSCHSLEQLQIPRTVQIIGMNAFYQCSQLREVELHSDGELEMIEDGAFAECTYLRRIVIPSSVKQVGEMAFLDCKALSEVVLPVDGEKLKLIGESAFAGTVLEQIDIPSSLAMLCNETFKNCTLLRDVKLHDGLYVISHHVFENCTSLEGITFPSTALMIGDSAFRGCSQLRSVELNEKMKTIGSGAFSGCVVLERIKIPASVETIGGDAFENCPMLVAVEFCEEIEDFVSQEPVQDWWTRGSHDHNTLIVYSFLAEKGIPGRLSKMKGKWWNNIHDMLKRLHSIEKNKETKYRDAIDAKLTVYEELRDVASELELALWKSKIAEQQHSDPPMNANLHSTMKAEYRMNCGASVIIPNVLSFLLSTAEVAEEKYEDEVPWYSGIVGWWEVPQES